MKRFLRSLDDVDSGRNYADFLKNVESQFNFHLIALQKALTHSHNSITSKTRSKLFEYSNQLRHRFGDASDPKLNKNKMANQATALTESLTSVSHLLVNEVEKSKYTLDTLVSSSAKVTENSEEFKLMSSNIANSKTLLSKYGRREFMDKILIWLALGFFFSCVFYVVGKRTIWKWMNKSFISSYKETESKRSHIKR